MIKRFISWLFPIRSFGSGGFGFEGASAGVGLNTWGAIAVGAGTVIAGGISANATKKAQAGANNANAAAVDSQNEAALMNWLASRGINPGNLGYGNTNDPVNTSLPLWATINGTPAEQALLGSILGAVPTNTNDPATYASVSQIEKFLGTERGQQVLQEINDARAGSDDPRSPAEWLRDHIQQTEQGNGTFSTLLRDFANQPAGVDGSLQNPATAVPPEIQALQDNALKTATGVYDGAIRNEEIAALQPVLDANTRIGEIAGARNDEMRVGSNRILNSELDSLANLYGVRAAGAGSIYDDAVRVAGDLYGARTSAADELFAAMEAAARNTYGAREQGANRIYDADLKYADTYRDAAQQALQRVLAQRTAANAIKGFAGESSGDALLRARTLSSGYQQSAGVRAQAGQSLAQSLAKAAELQAMDLGTAGTTKANTRGQAGVSKVQELGAASQRRATSLAGAGEMDAIAQMNARVANATRLASILDADARLAKENAALANATATAGIMSNDIARRLNSGGLAGSLYGSQLGLNSAAAGSQFTALDQVLSRLGQFRSNNSTPPTPQVYMQQPGITSGQIWGSALGSAAQGLGGYLQNQQLIAALNRPATTPAATSPTTPVFTSPGSMAPNTSLTNPGYP